MPQQILGGGAHHLDKVCEHGRKQRRRARNGRQEINAAQHEQLAGRDRFGGGIASTAVEQGELTERVAGTRTSKLNFAAILQRPAQSNRAGQNAVQRVASLALPKDDLSRFDEHGVPGLCDRAKQFVSDVGKQRCRGNGGASGCLSRSRCGLDAIVVVGALTGIATAPCSVLRAGVAEMG